MFNYKFHLLFRLAILPSLGASCAYSLGRQELTAAPRGPFHIERNRLVDSQEQPFLIRGTQLPAFGAQFQAQSAEFGPHSATVFSSIRQRWNMNAVRLPLNLADYASDPEYLQKAGEVVRQANNLELLVILNARGPDQLAFWQRGAAFFRDYPQIVFEPDSGPIQQLIYAIRAAGARQPVLVHGPDPVDDANALYMVSPSYATTRTDADRDRDFGALAARSAVLANDMDPALDTESAECVSFPADPSDAEALVEANLNYFDAHGISWVASEFRPGKLVSEYRHMYPSTLENGWTCGAPNPAADRAPAGIGEAIQFHLWGGELRGLFAVSAAGGFVLARGSVAIVYGGIFAERDTTNRSAQPSTELGKVSVLVTDSEGVTRLAGLLYVSAGWGQANIVVPSGSAAGPGRLTIARRDGSSQSTLIHIADVAPGFWTDRMDGRGPAIGYTGQMRISRCDGADCSTVPIAIPGPDGATVQLLGSGFRYAAGVSDVQVTVGRFTVPVVSFGPAKEAGLDQIVVRIPPSLRALGETDLYCSIGGNLSNVVRIAIGSEEQGQ
jgi:uncharacterized protein (TIGR03437 family)